jgi:hypothetical protein
MAWETMTREHARTTKPRVTISKLGRITLNNGAIALFSVKPTKVLLLWDKTSCKIALKPTENEEDERIYLLTAYGAKGKSGLGFSAGPFLNYISYDRSKTRAFPAEIAENMLVFSIPKVYFDQNEQRVR